MICSTDEVAGKNTEKNTHIRRCAAALFIARKEPPREWQESSPLLSAQEHFKAERSLLSGLAVVKGATGPPSFDTTILDTTTQFLAGYYYVRSP